MAVRVLIVEDDPAQRRILEELVRRFGCDPVPVDGGSRGLDILKSHSGGTIELIILDLNMPGMDGLEFLERLQSIRGDLPVIVQTAQGSIETVIKAMRAGADDFVVKPISPERLKISIQNLLKVNALTEEVRRLNKKVGGALTFSDLIASSPAMANVLRLGRRGAQSNIPILIEGESGVGKEMIARAIQGESERVGRPFVAVNCGAIPENLVESELFGHVKGSFTGAVRDSKGMFTNAHKGTIFLDEIGDLPLAMQVKLLRVLQEREVRPVGAAKPHKVDVRVISASNRKLEDEVAAGRFREDLFYRLNVVGLTLPPLAERREDIALLANRFMRSLAQRYAKPLTAFAPGALELLSTASWPGNVRQLQNVVEKCVVLCTGSLIPLSLVQSALTSQGSELLPLDDARKEFERAYLTQLLKITSGNVAQAAKLARRNRTDLYALLARHQIESASFKV